MDNQFSFQLYFNVKKKKKIKVAIYILYYYSCTAFIKLLKMAYHHIYLICTRVKSKKFPRLFIPFPASCAAKKKYAGYCAVPEKYQGTLILLDELTEKCTKNDKVNTYPA